MRQETGVFTPLGLNLASSWYEKKSLYASHPVSRNANAKLMQCLSSSPQTAAALMSDSILFTPF